MTCRRNFMFVAGNQKKRAGESRNKWLLQCAAACLLLSIGPVAPAMSDIEWSGEGADNLWSNPDNWFGGEVPSSAERAKVNGPDAESPNGPVIEDGIEAVTEVLIADSGTSSMSMTGGSLELSGWGTWWGDAAGSMAMFTMSGGVVEFTGGPGIMELGWQESGDPEGSSVGIWTMTGGEIFAKGVDMPGKNNGGTGVINLWGGTLNVGTARGGLVMYEGGLIDITDGLLVLEGDQSEPVEDYIENEWLTSFGGQGELSVEFDGDFTTVAAISLQGLQPGDADQDLDFDQFDLVRVQVAAKYLTAQPATWGEGDWNGGPGGSPGSPPAGDGMFNQLDIISALGAGKYLTGPYAAIGSGGQVGDGQTSIIYDPSSGELGVDAPAGVELTSINIDSAAAIFTAQPAQNLGGSFDNDTDGNIFKATFGGSFGAISFGNVAQSGLSQDFVQNDLTAVGSLAGGGDLGPVDLIYVPEPHTIVLAVVGFFASVFAYRRT